MSDYLELPATSSEPLSPEMSVPDELKKLKAIVDVFKTKQKEFEDTATRVQKRLDGQLTAFEKTKVDFEKTKIVVEGALEKFKSNVKLNVGGYKFETTLTTLTSDKESMLAAMFSGRHELNEIDGYVFIDRDGTHFGHILNILRGCSVDVCHKDANNLANELEYYGVSKQNRKLVTRY
jgi:hypothetical protein